MKLIKKIMAYILCFAIATGTTTITSLAAYDTTRPTIGSAKIIQESVMAPGHVTVELSDFVEEESGITQYSVVLTCADPNTGTYIDYVSQMGPTDKPYFTGDYVQDVL